MIPLTLLTHGSILHSQTYPEDIPQICKDNNFITAPLTDINSLSQCVSYYSVMKSAELKPIFGCTLNIDGSSVVCYARNKDGWKGLLWNFFKKSLENIDNQIFLATGDNYNNIKNLGGEVYSYYQLYSKSDGGEFPITLNSYQRKFIEHNKVLRSLQMGCRVSEYGDRNQYDFIHNENDLVSSGVSRSTINKFTSLMDSIEDYDITSPVDLPQLGGDSAIEISRLCYANCPPKDNYNNRLKYELDMINQAGMASYFLIVKDILDYVKDHGYFVGAGRGSVGGSLVAYLLGITNIDPLEYDLSFERFYTPDRKSLPDIDIDLQPEARDEIVKYLKGKYGEYNFAQVVTFNTLKGRAAIKAVLRTSDTNMSFKMQDFIAKLLPFEGKLADEISQQGKECGNESIILYTLKHQPSLLSRWCTLENDKYTGDYAKEFQLAVELDQTIMSQGRHASAFALSNKPMYEYAPMVWDDISKEYLLGVDMYGMDALGVMKLDLLGIDLLSKCRYITDIINGKERVLVYD